jgi:very-short-patch-repair endonuclease
MRQPAWRPSLVLCFSGLDGTMTGARVRAPILTFKRARALRREMSLPEVQLWDCLRGGRLDGLRFRRQHSVGLYILDFYCASARLAVEIDGAGHDSQDRAAHDQRRDASLAKRGIRVIRIMAADILSDDRIDAVLRVIAEAAERRPGS